MQTRKIVCPTADPKQIGVLARITDLLQSYLASRWEVVSEGPADVWLVDLDSEASAELFEKPPAQPVVAYSDRVRNREMKLGRADLEMVIHKKFRAAEILAILQKLENSQTRKPAQPVESKPQDGGGRKGEKAYRVVRWPARPGSWPREHRKIIAAIATQPLSKMQIATRAGVNGQIVLDCLQRLERNGVLERVEVPRRESTHHQGHVGDRQGVRGILGALRKRIGLAS
jgi:hypothetical protein